MSKIFISKYNQTYQHIRLVIIVRSYSVLFGWNLIEKEDRSEMYPFKNDPTIRMKPNTFGPYENWHQI